MEAMDTLTDAALGRLFQARAQQSPAGARAPLLVLAAEIGTGLAHWMAAENPDPPMPTFEPSFMEPALTALASLHQPNAARRATDTATLAASALLAGDLDRYRNTIEKSVAYCDRHPTPPVRWHRHVRHVTMLAFTRFVLSDRGPDATESARRTIGVLRTSQETYEKGALKGNMGEHYALDLLTLYHLSGCLDEVVGGPGRGVENARRNTRTTRHYNDDSLKLAVPWVVGACSKLLAQVSQASD